jgi:hypothetical protein
MLVNLLRGGVVPPERLLMMPSSFPAMQQLANYKAKSHASGSK